MNYRKLTVLVALFALVAFASAKKPFLKKETSLTRITLYDEANKIVLRDDSNSTDSNSTDSNSTDSNSTDSNSTDTNSTSNSTNSTNGSTDSNTTSLPIVLPSDFTALANVYLYSANATNPLTSNN